MRATKRAATAALALAAGALAGGIAHAGAPYGVHVAFGADARSTATVAWFTSGLTDPGSTIEYGTTAALGSTLQGTAQKVQGLNNLVHEVALSGLPAGAEIFYRVGGSSGFSPISSFTTDDGDASFRMTVFGDHGITAQSQRTMEHVLARDPDVHVIPGDISYAQPGDGSFADLSKWETWFRMMEPFATQVPVMAAPGNHETEAAGGTASYRTRFALPGAEEYYSFEVGRVHVLVLQSDVTGTARTGIQAQQQAFARADLAQADLRREMGELDFIVVVQHHPIYGTQASSLPDSHLGRKVNPFQVALLEPLLVQHGVDLVLVAHNHHFERSLRMIGQQPLGAPEDASAPGYVQLTTGGGGQSLYGFDAAGAPWSVARASRFHYTEIDAAPGELRIRVVSTDENPGEILDAFTLRAR